MYYPFVRKALFQLDPERAMNLHFNNYAALQVRRWKRWCARKYRQSRLPAWDLPLKIHWGWLPVWIKTGSASTR